MPIGGGQRPKVSGFSDRWARGHADVPGAGGAWLLKQRHPVAHRANAGSVRAWGLSLPR